MKSIKKRSLLFCVLSLILLVLSFACFGVDWQTKNQVSAQTNTKAVARNVKLVVYFEQLNEGNGGIYSKGVDGGYAWTDSEDTQKLNYEWTFSSASFEQFFLKSTTGYELSGIYSEFDETQNTFSGTTLETTKDGSTYTASLGDSTESTFYVVFTKKRLTVSIENDTLCRVNGAGEYLYGSVVTISFVNDLNKYQFVQWSKVLGEKEELFATQETYSFEITESCVLKIKCKYFVDIPENDFGSVIVKHNNTQTSERYFDPNTVLSFTAKPNLGYNFVDWNIDQFLNKGESFEWTLTSPISFNAVFESKKVSVSISTNDSEHCQFDGSSQVDGIMFSIGDSITLNLNINSQYVLESIQNNASGEFDPSLTTQTYIITAQDVENGELEFMANIYKKISQIKLTISGSGTIQIGDATYSSNQTIELQSHQNYAVVMTAEKMFYNEKITYVYGSETKEFDLTNGSKTLNFNYDGEITVVFRHLLWYDDKQEFEGYGTKSSPYLIKTPQNLAYMAFVINNHITPSNPNCVNYNEARYKIVNDINLDGKFWILIGTSDNVEFSGVIDTNFKKVENVYVVSDYGRYSSFARLFTEANGKNLKLENDLPSLWENIGIYSSIFFGVALIIVVVFTIFSDQKAKKVVVLSEEVIDKKS